MKLQPSSRITFLILSWFVCLVTVNAEKSPDPLESLRWQQRLLIGIISDPSTARILTSGLEKNLKELEERKCLVLIWFDEKWITNRSRNFSPEDSDLRNAITTRTKSFHLALVGLDGGVKSRYQIKEFSWDRLFAEIDAMPMRRREMRSEKSGF